MAKKLTKWQAIDAAPGALAAREALKRMLHEEQGAGRPDIAKSVARDLARMEKFIAANGLERYADRT